MHIADCPIGTEICLVSCDFDEATSFRLRELGLCPGTCAKVLQRTPFGGRLLSIAGQRIAVDRDTTRRFTVELTAAPAGLAPAGAGSRTASIAPAATPAPAASAW